MKKRAVLLFLLCGITNAAIAQSTTQIDSIHKDTVKNITFSYKQLIIPTALISYGVIGLDSDQLKSWNGQVRDKAMDIDQKISIDDFSQWTPAASVFALNAFGDKGKNNLQDRATIIITSYVIWTSTVFALKSITHVQRPDGTTYDSFPSGHTANAFAGAEFLRQEYKDKSVWYGIAGYAVAAGTGIFRIVNNRHWLTDVAAGAGIGILSTKIAYWTNPYIKRKLFGKNSNATEENMGTEKSKSTSIILPSYDGKTVGLTFIKTF